MEPKTRNPHLFPRDHIADYTLQDALDASTPEELSTASWFMFLNRMRASQRLWDKWGSRTFLISPKCTWNPAELIQGVEETTPMERIFARRVVDGRVVRRAWGYMLGGLSEKDAFRLPYTQCIGGILYNDKPGYSFWEIPPSGPSKRISIAMPHQVVAAMGFEFEIEIPEELRSIIQTYGFNAIPQFRRLFELRAEAPLPGLF